MAYEYCGKNRRVPPPDRGRLGGGAAAPEIAPCDQCRSRFSHGSVLSLPVDEKNCSVSRGASHGRRKS